MFGFVSGKIYGSISAFHIIIVLALVFLAGYFVHQAQVRQ
jgi:hypothetical protein